MSTTITRTLVAEECINCGVLFGVTPTYREQRKSDHRNFTCPNGHPQYYPGKSELEKAREDLARTQGRLTRVETSLTHTRDQLEATERSRRAIKGQLTKVKKRVVAGTCPAGCRRHFSNLQTHLETMHPDYAKEHHDE